MTYNFYDSRGQIGDVTVHGMGIIFDYCTKYGGVLLKQFCHDGFVEITDSLNTEMSLLPKVEDPVYKIEVDINPSRFKNITEEHVINYFKKCIAKSMDIFLIKLEE